MAAVVETIKEGVVVGSRDKSVGWYKKDLETLSRDARKLLEDYSRIPAEQVESHILEVRDRAWEVWPFPCIGRCGFVDLFISETPSYPSVLKRLRGGDTFLDLGCCFAQDIRKLVADGVPAENLWGAELHADFIEMGYELFVDKQRLKSTFLVADVFDEAGPLAELRGTIDIVQAALFLHLFSWEGQRTALKQIISILKPRKGSMVVGRQVGSAKPGEYPSQRGTMYRHDVASFERLWKEVGEATGSEWKVWAVLDGGLGVDSKQRSWDNDDSRRIGFEVERI